MALGNSGIAAARQELSTVGAKVVAARSSNQNFIKLYNDQNFQKFVAETNKGAVINQQLQQLSKWIDSMCDTIESMKSKTESYLSQQESLNK